MLEKREVNRHHYYSFLRRRKKPTVGSLKEIKFPPIGDSEDVNVYFDRCHSEVGARPAPIGPMKKKPRNSKCVCNSGKKFKHCCGRGL